MLYTTVSKDRVSTSQLKDAFGLFNGVVPFLLLGAGIGAFIYEFIPTDLLANLVGAGNLWAVPLAAVVGIPMYIHTEIMIPIASILISKGVAPIVSLGGDTLSQED